MPSRFLPRSSPFHPHPHPHPMMMKLPAGALELGLELQTGAHMAGARFHIPSRVEYVVVAWSISRTATYTHDRLFVTSDLRSTIYTNDTTNNLQSPLHSTASSSLVVS